VQTHRDIGLFTGPLLELAKVDPRRRLTRGAIYLESYYPLPWVLGDFPYLGYYGKIPEALPDDVTFHVVEGAKADELRARLGPGYREVRFRLRSGVDDCVAFFRNELYEAMEKAGQFRRARRGEL
jgi:hypothetical protein